METGKNENFRNKLGRKVPYMTLHRSPPILQFTYSNYKPITEYPRGPHNILNIHALWM